MPTRKLAGALAADAKTQLPPEEFLNTAQAAHILQRSSKTLEFWRILNKGPRYFKQGRVVRYLRSDVFRWGVSQCVETRDTAAIEDAQKTPEAKAGFPF